MDAMFPSTDVMDFWRDWAYVAIFAGVLAGFVPAMCNYIWRIFRQIIGGV